MRRLINISRPCYDKYHRCPGWAGGGTRHPKVGQCEGGSLAADPRLYEGRWWRWRFNRCPLCRVVILPYRVRWGDPGWWKWKIQDIPGRVEDWRWERRHRRERQS
jgi:hypothetical protein